MKNELNKTIMGYNAEDLIVVAEMMKEEHITPEDPSILPRHLHAE